MSNDTIENPEADRPHEIEAKKYLEKNRILELIDNMTSMLIYAKPDEPKAFLIQQMEKLKLARQSGVYYPCLFDETNITSIFGMLDPTKRGFITRDQYLEALKTIGAQDFVENPIGSDVDRITMDTFMREAKSALSKASATFNESS